MAPLEFLHSTDEVELCQSQGAHTGVTATVSRNLTSARAHLREGLLPLGPRTIVSGSKRVLTKETDGIVHRRVSRR